MDPPKVFQKVFKTSKGFSTTTTKKFLKSLKLQRDPPPKKKKKKVSKKLKINKGFSFEILALDLLYQHIRKFVTGFSILFGQTFSKFATGFSKPFVQTLPKFCHWM